MKTAGISLIVIGLVLTFFSAFTFLTKEKVVDTPVVEISKKEAHRLPLSPLIGLAITCLGGFLLWQTTKK
jgi:hypothetical protein